MGRNDALHLLMYTEDRLPSVVHMTANHVSRTIQILLYTFTIRTKSEVDSQHSYSKEMCGKGLRPTVTPIRLV